MFTHLHVHTEYSLLDGASKLPVLVKRAKELNMNSLAITDHGVMYGVIGFYKECVKSGIKPIIGCEVYIAPDSRFEKDKTKGDKRYYHLILLAKNNKGYENLMKLVSIGFLEGFYYKPRIDKEVLAQYSEGLVCLSACIAGEVACYLKSGFYEQAKDVALWYQDLFGDDYYLEMQDHGYPEQRLVNQGLLRLHQETGIPLVATNDSHYVYAEDAANHDVLLCIQTGSLLNDENRMRYPGGQFYLKSEEEMSALFPYAPEAISNTQVIADKCNVTITFGEYKLPRYPLPEGTDSFEYLKSLCLKGLELKYADSDIPRDTILDRLNYELDVIRSMGFTDYFLIVWDYVAFAKNEGIAVGPGRGSAAGSIVSYCLNITEIDPLKYDLLFERFLNPERVSMPDIDVDFDDVRRKEVMDYVIGKYGEDHVAEMVVFGTLAAKMAIRDVGRVMDLPPALVDRVAKLVPSGPKVTISQALSQNDELADLYDEDDTVRKLIDTAKALEGLPRHTGNHPAGILITADYVGNYVPLIRSSSGMLCSQYIHTEIEKLGLLKMDFLALRNLRIIQDAVALAIRDTGEDLDISNIPLDDKATYDLLSSGNLLGVFQLESPGMRRFMKEFKPRRFEDITDGLALYRPGPMDVIPRYIKCRDNPEYITYADEKLKPILSSTYGCIIYQEQVMNIFRDLAGFSLGQSDNVRRAISKKHLDDLEEQRDIFINGSEELNVPGAVKNGVDRAVAENLFNDILDFANYAFNKSHAAAYGMVAYQTAYLKAHFPREYMAALMTSVYGNINKITEYTNECRNLKIAVLPPDINLSMADFTAEEDGIRYGLSAIKSLSWPLVEAIVKERKKNGDFKDLQDLINRISARELNKRGIEALIKSGAFDSFKATRKQMLQVYEKIVNTVAIDKRKNIAGQQSLFDMGFAGGAFSNRISYPDCGEYDDEIKLAFEKEVLGTYVSSHPLLKYKDFLDANVTHYCDEFTVDEEQGENVPDGATVTIGGMITNLRIRTTQRGQSMANLSLEDLTGAVEVIMFPKVFEPVMNKISEDVKCFIYGRVRVDGEDVTIIADTVLLITDIPREIYIKFKNTEEYLANEAELLKFLSSINVSRKASPIIIYCEEDKKLKRLEGKYGIQYNEENLYDLIDRYGEENVKTKLLSIKPLIQKKRFHY